MEEDSRGLLGEKCLDVEGLAAVIGGDFEGARSILSEFLEKSGEELKMGIEAIEQGDWVRTKSIFHKMAGSSFAVCAEDLAQREREVEYYVQEEEVSEVRVMEKVRRVSEALTRVQKAFEKTDWGSL